MYFASVVTPWGFANEMNDASTPVPSTFARPSVGAWVSYGLGTENRNLPSFMVLAPVAPYAGAQTWGSDFLPGCHQGTRVVAGTEPISNLARRAPSPRVQELELGLLDRFNQLHRQDRPDDPAAKLHPSGAWYRVEVAAEAVGVAGAVEVLVVAADGCEHLAVADHRPEDALADHRVAVDCHALGRGREAEVIPAAPAVSEEDTVAPPPSAVTAHVDPGRGRRAG